ncbi:OmpP1/FadL family transporter [Psychromonas antarctica]|uniref:OmpP1/FadL family transporter n=1 Tax=Psychromonas antarctica TaxID=67573 RepID=UPI001EE8F74A|nr:outer membrane protein transport protein [Psychromonas antarctica]MCG6200305.1 outer membrane protein transport protein [Psychromonas antarctica]
MKKIPLLLANIVGLTLISPSVFATNGMISHGYGSIDKALAGSGVAYSQEAMSMALNPAGLVNVKDSVDLNIAVFAPTRGYRSNGEASPAFSIGPQHIESDNSLFPIPSFAIAKKLNEHTTLGFSLYGSGGMNTQYEGGTATMFNQQGESMTLQGTFGDGTAGVNLTQLFFNSSIASQLNEDHSIGLSLLLGFQTFSATGLANFAGFSLDSDKLSNNGTDYSYGYGFKIGYQGKLTDTLHIGASYQTKIKMSEFEKYSGLFANDGSLDMPATLQVGLAWEIQEQTLLFADIQHIDYSDVPAIGNKADNLFDCMQLAGSQSCLGGSSSTGFGWNDMTVYKIGLQWDMLATTWRLGYSYAEQPVGQNELLFNILAPGVVKKHYTAGFSKKVTTNFVLHGAFMYAPENKVSGQNPLSGLDPNGYDSQSIAIYMSQMEVQFGIQWII